MPLTFDEFDYYTHLLKQPVAKSEFVAVANPLVLIDPEFADKDAAHLYAIYGSEKVYAHDADTEGYYKASIIEFIDREMNDNVKDFPLANLKSYVEQLRLLGLDAMTSEFERDGQTIADIRPATGIAVVRAQHNLAVRAGDTHPVTSTIIQSLFGLLDNTCEMISDAKVMNAAPLHCIRAAALDSIEGLLNNTEGMAHLVLRKGTLMLQAGQISHCKSMLPTIFKRGQKLNHTESTMADAKAWFADQDPNGFYSYLETRAAALVACGTMEGAKSQAAVVTNLMARIKDASFVKPAVQRFTNAAEIFSGFIPARLAPEASAKKALIGQFKRTLGPV